MGAERQQQKIAFYVKSDFHAVFSFVHIRHSCPRLSYRFGVALVIPLKQISMKGPLKRREQPPPPKKKSDYSGLFFLSLNSCILFKQIIASCDSENYHFQ